MGGGGGRGRGLHQPRGRERVRAGDRLQAEEQVLLPLTWPHHSRMFCRFEKLAVEPEAPQVRPNPRKFQVKRFKVDKTLKLNFKIYLITYIIFMMLFN